MFINYFIDISAAFKAPIYRELHFCMLIIYHAIIVHFRYYKFKVKYT